MENTASVIYEWLSKEYCLSDDDRCEPSIRTETCPSATLSTTISNVLDWV